ncbi:hypothetical protein [Paenibacillus sp. 32352]|uniref:hypothetical protein n=1 Tax=Paenibacillus sp. 32352 TaxID=1969111 RepID=UPI0021193D79|nr:hypothetical protein [Paenibacillus sp. 32352]
MNASIQWNAEQQAVEVSVNDSKHTYSTADGSLLLQNGSSYLNMNRFKQDFPELNWSDTDGQVELSVTKG